MPIDREINLDRDLTEEDIKQLEKEADLIEKAAKKAEKEAEKLDKIEKKVDDQTKRIDKKIGRVVKASNNLTSSRSPLGALGGNQVFADDNSQGTQFGEGSSHLPLKSKDQSSHAPAAYRSGPDYEAPHVPTPKEIEQMIEGKVNILLQATGSPIQFFGGRLLGIAKASAIGAALFLTEEVFEEIVNRVKSLFAPGGVFDVRKLVLDASKEINSLKVITKIENGIVYFSSDTSEILRQGVTNGVSNTRDLVYGHKRYLQIREP